MNKFEKLIEYIINDEDQKARELFHTIVVEKSRDIYESIMDEESMEEKVHGDQVGDMVDELSHDESHAMESDDEGEEEFGDEEGDMSGGEEHIDTEMHGEHGEIEDQVMNIDAKLDELLAKFDEIMGDEGHSEEMPAEEPGMEHGEEGMMEAGNPFAKSGMSGKSGSSSSGKSGSGSAASGKSGSAKMEAAKAGSAVSGKSGASGKSGSAMSGKSGKGSAEMMREYVDRIGDIYGGEGDAAEGTIVGANTGSKDRASVNKKSGSVGPGADFGGTEKNIVHGGAEEAVDGKPINKPSNEYSKGEGKLPGAGKFENVPGAKAKQTSTGEEYSKEHPKDGSGAGAKDTGLGRQNTKSVQKQNTGIKK